MADRLNKLVLWFLGALFFIILSVVIVTMNRGFDFQDESFYLLCYSYPHVYQEGVSGFHVIIHTISAWLNPGIVTYRVETLLFTLFSSWAFWVGLRRWLLTHMPGGGMYTHPLFLFFVVFTGNFVHYFVGLQTINYNILINSFIMASAGILLYLFSHSATLVGRSWKHFILTLVVGALCWFSFVTKFSTGVLELVGFSGLVFTYYIGKSVRACMAIIGGMLLGVLVGAGFFFLFFQSLPSWWANFSAGYIEITKPTDHPPGLILQGYLQDVHAMIWFAIFSFGWLAVYPVLLLANKKWSNNKLFVLCRNSIVAVGFFWFCYRLIQMDMHRSNFVRNWNYRNGYIYPVIMGLEIILLIVVAWQRRINLLKLVKTRFHFFLIMVFLVFLPLLGTMGTSNQLFLNLLFNAASWFVFIALLAALLARYVSAAVAGLFIFVSFGFTASQIIDGNTFSPYFTAFRKAKTNIFQQTVKADDFPQLKGIYIDTASLRFLKELKGHLQTRGFRNLYPMWTFSAGMTYAMGGLQTEVFWYNKTCTSVGKFMPHNEPPIFVVADDQKKLSPYLDTCFRERGIKWPEDYEQTGQVWFPHFATMAKIYYPKNYR